jgi:hypothetical protein
MSTPLGQEVGYYVGKSDLDSLMWEGSHIIDAEREYQDHMGYLGYKVEWEDKQQRHCELTSRTVADPDLIKQANSKYGYVIYHFRRRDIVDNADRNYIIFSDTGAIEQRDMRMGLLPSNQKMKKKDLIASILESFDGYGYEEILSSITPDNEDGTPGLSEEEQFNNIVYNFRKDGIMRRMSKRVLGMFMPDTPV